MALFTQLMMQTSYRNGLILGGTLLCVLGLWAEPRLVEHWQLSDFKHKVQSNCDPFEIQRWAIRLQAEHGPDYTDQTGTNLPRGFSKLNKLPPYVATLPDGGVAIGWGRYHSMYVGSSNYSCSHQSERWIPGVYFDQGQP